ncbi:putative GPI-anchored protein pfl2 [Papilio machaon]|uniref:putative GPI-anchored protein pfl2 n=1 Tax=Papilio machaon TaxID=76193 RepID=UPI001E664C6A|nr:putative GPI-anchored protein pfl2 [Papilio machaon]
MRRIDNSSSQDGVETTSITSSVENEVRKQSSKAKRNSIKRKMPNFNDDSDDTVNEPLLQPENDIREFNQSAKFVSSKPKTDSTNERSDNANIGTKIQKTSPENSSENNTFKSITTDVASASTSVTAPIRNYMNTNIFGVIDTTASNSTKSTLIVEIDNTKSSAYSPSPLIFTTAKIHTDNKTKDLEPLQVTPVPILSTIEGNVIKSIPSTFHSSEKHNDGVKSKSENQKKCNYENEQSIIKNASHIKEHSETIGSNIKSTVVSTNEAKPAPGQSTKQTSLDMTLISQADSKIPIGTSKVDVIISTSTNILLDEKTQTTAVDTTKKNVSEKSLVEHSKFEIQQKPRKTNNEKQSFLIDESQKQTSNGVTPQKHSLNANKASILTSSNSENKSNKEKATKSVSSLPINKQLQRQKKTVEDISISDAKNQNIVCDPKVNISQDSTSLPENKIKGSIINPTMPKTSLELPTKCSSSSMSDYSAVSDKPTFVSSVLKGEVNISDKTGPATSVLSGKGKNVDKKSSLISEPTEKKNIPDKTGSLISVPKGKTVSSDKPVFLTSITPVTANSNDRSKNISKTSPLTSVPSGKANNIDKSGSMNSGPTGKTNTADKHVSASSVPIVKPNTIEKPSSSTSVPLSKENIENKPDSSSSVSAVSTNNNIKPGPVASVSSVKVNTAGSSTSLTSASKGAANSTTKPGSVNSVLSEKVNTIEKFASVKSTPKEQTNTVISSSKNTALVTKSSRKDPVTTTSGSNISKPITAKSSGKELVAELKKVSEKPKTKISPTLKSESTIAPSDSKSNKSIPFTASTNVLTNVATSVGNKKLGIETHATSSSSVTSSIKGSVVSSLPSSSTSAKNIIGTNKNIEPMFSENNKDSRA